MIIITILITITDFHKLTFVVLRLYCTKQKPTPVLHWKYKNDLKDLISGRTWEWVAAEQINYFLTEEFENNYD